MKKKDIETRIQELVEGRLSAEEKQSLLAEMAGSAELERAVSQYREIFDTEKSIAQKEYRLGPEFSVQVMEQFEGRAPSIFWSLVMGVSKLQRRIMVPAAVLASAVVALVVVRHEGGHELQFAPKPKLSAESAEALQNLRVVAPTTQVPKGAKLTSSDVREITVPRDSVPEDAVRSFSDIENMYATEDLLPNTPILRSNVSAEKPLGGISDLLPPGSRAVTVSVDGMSAVEGWFRPGVHVDAIVTYTDPSDGQTKSRVVAEDITVLSYGGSAAVVGS